MATEALRRESPATREEAAARLGAAAGEGVPVRFRGGGTKFGWGGLSGEPGLELATGRLDRVVEHNAGDLTAVLEAGVPLARAQDVFAGARQMLALDPPDPGGATVGGIVATGDSGPLRARYGAARDLVVGIVVALPDGSVARAGGKVIKNVAGYDLAKLFCGSFGTLGLVLEVAVRLHPLPAGTVTASGSGSDPAALARAASALSHSPLELRCLDVRWEGGAGAVLARAGGAAPMPQAEAAGRLLRDADLQVELVEEDGALWEAQRAGQRSTAGTVVRVSAVQASLPAVLRAAERFGATLVGRAGLGLSWLRLEGRGLEETAAAVEDLRRELAPAACVVLDALPGLRERIDPWGPLERPALELMRRVRERFDPAAVCNSGVGVVRP